MAPVPPTFLPSTQVPACEMDRHHAWAVAPFKERSAWAARLGQAWTRMDQVLRGGGCGSTLWDLS